MYRHPTDGRKFYIGTPKTGTKTIADAIIAAHDLSPKARTRDVRYGSHHSGVVESDLDPEKIETVSFVRNHYRRMVSWAVHHYIRSGRVDLALDVKLMQGAILDKIGMTHSWVHSREGSLYYRWTEGVTHVLRYEDGDLFDQLRSVGWDLVAPEHDSHVCRNIYRPWYEYYDAEFVKHFEPYHDEMRLYGYEIDEWDQ